MKLAAFLIALIAAAAPAGAAPSVSVRWGSCPFPASTDNNRNAHTGPVETISVTVRGLSGPVRGVQVFLLFSSPGGLADAWRYDGAGCEARRVTFNAVPPGDPCPLLTSANAAVIDTFQYFDDTMKGRAVSARTLNAFVADPNQAYTLARFDFDHSSADTCGCLERPICIFIYNATYLDDSFQELPFVMEREFLTWNDPVNRTSCPNGGSELATYGDATCESQPTPAARSSWGRVKATYR